MHLNLEFTILMDFSVESGYLFFQQIWEFSGLSFCTGWENNDVKTSNLLWNFTGFCLYF